MNVRDFRSADAPTMWALSVLPNIGATADPSTPVPLPPAVSPPAAFPDLAAVPSSFDAFLIADLEGHLVGMGGLRITASGRAEVLRVRVHPARRRRGVGRALMTALEERAAELGVGVLHLDTALNQPEAMAFYRSLGYREVGRETQPGWSWTLVYYEKVVMAMSETTPEGLRFLSGLIVVSADPERLVGFYRDILGLPLVEEQHDDTEVHWGCELGDVHFAIHPSADYPGEPTAVGAVKLAFMVFDLDTLITWLTAHEIELCYPPEPFGAGSRITAIRDPDGNLVELTELTELGPSWLDHLRTHRANGGDLVAHWTARHPG